MSAIADTGEVHPNERARSILRYDLLEKAAWRRMKSQEYPDDARNARAAKTLEDLALRVGTLARDDQRLAAVAVRLDEWGMDHGFLTHQATRAGFHNRPIDLDRELRWIIDESIHHWSLMLDSVES